MTKLISDRSLTFGVFNLTPDQHAIGRIQVYNGRTFGQEFWVGQDVESHAVVRAVALEHLFNGLRRSHGHRRLLNDDLITLGARRDGARRQLPVRQIRRLTFS